MMKSIEIEALSLVMAVWCGISRNCSRRSTQEVLSVTGLMNDESGTSESDGPTEPEQHDPLVLPDDLHRECEHDEKKEDDNPDDDANDHVLRSLLSPSSRRNVPSAGAVSASSPKTSRWTPVSGGLALEYLPAPSR